MLMKTWWVIFSITVSKQWLRRESDRVEYIPKFFLRGRDWKFNMEYIMKNWYRSNPITSKPLGHLECLLWWKFIIKTQLDIKFPDGVELNYYHPLWWIYKHKRLHFNGIKKGRVLYISMHPSSPFLFPNSRIIVGNLTALCFGWW